MIKAKIYKKYPKESMEEAIDAVKNSNMTMYRASQIYGVPRITLSDKINGMSKNVHLFCSTKSVKVIINLKLIKEFFKIFFFTRFLLEPRL